MRILDQRLDEGGRAYVAGRLVDARAAYEAARSLAPDDVRAESSLAVIDLREGRLTSARERLRRVVSRQPRLAHAWRNLAAVCQDLGLWDEAIRALRRLVEVEPEDAEARFALAAALVTVGRIEAGLKLYRLLAADPRLRLRALARVGLLRPLAITVDEAREIERALQTGEPTLDVRIALCFALGAVRDAAGATDAAFEVLDAGNRLKRQALDTGPAHDRPQAVLRAHVAAARHMATLSAAGAFDRRVADGDPALAPIFIVGMPRTGSSLVEQILASHGDVVGMGETALLPRLLERSYPGRAGEPFARPIEDLREAYLQALRERGWDGRRRFVDKTLENYLHIGVIRLMFPRSVILESTRNPADTCFACWRQLFSHGAQTLYHMEEIAAEYLAYSRLMAHWRGEGVAIAEVGLEALAADPGSGIRRLVTEACGLSWDPRCLRFWMTQRAVRTASAAQVRQPMTSAGVGRWRRYERHQGPLQRALAPVLHA
jgi:tetratricopeptide (TPR) repeat protein